jgi:hypothetical protein
VDPVIKASKWRWATFVISILRAVRGPRRCGVRSVEIRRCLSRRVAIGLNSFCPSAALSEAAFIALSSVAYSDISAVGW